MSRWHNRPQKTNTANEKLLLSPLVGQLKNSGFRGFSVRSKDKVAGKFSLVCVKHNIKKIANVVAKGLILPEFGEWAN